MPQLLEAPSRHDFLQDGSLCIEKYFKFSSPVPPNKRCSKKSLPVASLSRGSLVSGRLISTRAALYCPPRYRLLDRWDSRTCCCLRASYDDVSNDNTLLRVSPPLRLEHERISRAPPWANPFVEIAESGLLNSAPENTTTDALMPRTQPFPSQKDLHNTLKRASKRIRDQHNRLMILEGLLKTVQIPWKWQYEINLPKIFCPNRTDRQCIRQDVVTLRSWFANAKERIEFAMARQQSAMVYSQRNTLSLLQENNKLRYMVKTVMQWASGDYGDLSNSLTEAGKVFLKLPKQSRRSMQTIPLAEPVFLSVGSRIINPNSQCSQESIFHQQPNCCSPFTNVPVTSADVRHFSSSRGEALDYVSHFPTLQPVSPRPCKQPIHADIDVTAKESELMTVLPHEQDMTMYSNQQLSNHVDSDSLLNPKEMSDTAMRPSETLQIELRNIPFVKSVSFDTTAQQVARIPSQIILDTPSTVSHGISNQQLQDIDERTYEFNDRNVWNPKSIQLINKISAGYKSLVSPSDAAEPLLPDPSSQQLTQKAESNKNNTIVQTLANNNQDLEPNHFPLPTGREITSDNICSRVISSNNATLPISLDSFSPLPRSTYMMITHKRAKHNVLSISNTNVLDILSRSEETQLLDEITAKDGLKQKVVEVTTGYRGVGPNHRWSPSEVHIGTAIAAEALSNSNSCPVSRPEARTNFCNQRVPLRFEALPSARPLRLNKLSISESPRVFSCSASSCVKVSERGMLLSSNHRTSDKFAQHTIVPSSSSPPIVSVPSLTMTTTTCGVVLNDKMDHGYAVSNVKNYVTSNQPKFGAIWETPLSFLDGPTCRRSHERPQQQIQRFLPGSICETQYLPQRRSQCVTLDH